MSFQVYPDGYEGLSRHYVVKMGIKNVLNSLACTVKLLNFVTISASQWVRGRFLLF